MDLGFMQNFDIVWANEKESMIAKSYESNIGKHIVVEDIEDIAKNAEMTPDADIFIGGPPCTNFSSSGNNSGDEGKTGKLVWTYQEIIKKKKPMAFIMENVVGMVTRHKNTLAELIQSYTDIGYNVNMKVLDSSKFGTPQTRERLFIVGIRADLDFFFEFPKGTNKAMTVREAFADLKKPINTNPRDRILGEIPNHIATWTNPNPERILDLHLTTRPNQWIGTRRLEWDKPAYTITAHIAKDGREFLHPSENRRITQREALRLMGVPDSYVIPAHIPLKHQYTLIGNGVAYQVAKALSNALKEQLEYCLDTRSIEPQILEYRIEEQLSFDDLLFI